MTTRGGSEYAEYGAEYVKDSWLIVIALVNLTEKECLYVQVLFIGKV